MIIDLEAERRSMLLDLERVEKGEIEPRPIRKTVYFSEVKQVGPDEDRVLRFVGSDETQDRDRDVIEVAGWVLENYRKNPVFLWAHSYWNPPVGQALKVWKEDGRLMFDVKFATAEEYAFADTIYRLYRGGYLRAVSVGFIPKKWEQITEGEGESRRVVGLRFTKQELLELSAVPVPSNPNALEVARAKGIDVGLLEERLGTVRVLVTRFDGGVEELDYRAEQDEVFRTLNDGLGRKFVVPAWVEDAVKAGGETPVIEVVPGTAEAAQWKCPHCGEAIGEKELYFDGANWFHRPCTEKGAVRLPRDPDGDALLNKTGFAADLASEIITVYAEDGEPRSFTFEWLQSVNLEQLEVLQRNSDEFLRLARFVAENQLGQSGDDTAGLVTALLGEKAGAVLNRKNKERLQEAQALIQEVLDSAESEDDDDKGAALAGPVPDPGPEAGPERGLAADPGNEGQEAEDAAVIAELMVLLDASSEEELLHKLARLTNKRRGPGISAQDVATLTADTVRNEIRRLQGKVG